MPSKRQVNLTPRYGSGRGLAGLPVCVGREPGASLGDAHGGRLWVGGTLCRSSTPAQVNAHPHAGLDDTVVFDL